MSVTKKKEKEITTQELLESINRSFSKLEERMATKDDIKGLKNQIEGINNRIDDVYLNSVKYKDHNTLKKRVEVLEKI